MHIKQGEMRHYIIYFHQTHEPTVLKVQLQRAPAYNEHFHRPQQ